MLFKSILMNNSSFPEMLSVSLTNIHALILSFKYINHFFILIVIINWFFYSEVIIFLIIHFFIFIIHIGAN